MEKREIDFEMENLLKKILDEKEFKVFKRIIENRGNLDFKEGK